MGSRKSAWFGVHQLMNQAQLKVLVKVLDESARQFSNHGCNDFRLNELGLSPDELASFKEGFTKFMQGDDPQYEEYGNCVQDWLVMRYLQDVADKESKA